METKIVKIFNEKGPGWMDSDIAEDNFELKAIVSELNKLETKALKILEVGSGTGRFAGKLKDMGFSVVGIEPAERLRNIAKRKFPNVEFLDGLATRLPFEDENFDVVLLIEVLEHISNTELAIEEMYRVIKPSGKLIIIDKNIDSLHYLFFIPTKFWKWWKEITNQWMYARDFGFTEKYFSVSDLRSVLKIYFPVVSTNPLLFSLVEKERSFPFYMIAGLYKQISIWVNRWMPLNSFFYMWVATK